MTDSTSARRLTPSGSALPRPCRGRALLLGAALAALPFGARAEAQTAGTAGLQPVSRVAGALAPATAVIGARSGRAADAKAAAFGRVVGRLTDGQTGESLIGGQVAVQGLPLGNVSDDAGDYFINNVPVGKQTFTVEYLGYEPQAREHEVQPGASTTLDFALAPTVIALEAVVVEEEVVRDLSEYVAKTPAPSFTTVELKPVEVAKPDTSLMEEWHRSMRNTATVHSIEYPLTRVRVYYRRPAPKLPPAQGAAAGAESPSRTVPASEAPRR